MSTYICKLCGKEFERVGNGVYCAGPHYRPCPVCGKPVEYKRPSEPYKCCSKECTRERKAATKLSRATPKACAECGKMFVPKQSNQKYCDNPHFASCIVCGIEFSYLCKPPERPHTCSKKCQEQMRSQTAEQRYGVNNVAKIDYVREKIHLSKVDKENYLKQKAENVVHKSRMVDRVCKLCGETFKGTPTSDYCAGPHYKPCEVCGELFAYNPIQPKRCCSPKCSSTLSIRTMSKDTAICKICGRPFPKRSGMQEYCSGPHYAPCPVCGKPTLWKNPNFPVSCCSDECSNRLRETTNMGRYGVPVASMAESVREKLSVIGKSEETKQKQINTSMKHYGVPYSSQSPIVRQKISNTVNSDECKAKTCATTMKRLGVPYAAQSEIVQAKIQATNKERYGVPYYCMSEAFQEASGNIISTLNRSVGDMLQQLNIEYLFEHRMGRYSYDIIVPDRQLLIEVNPTYTHNSYGNHWGRKLEPLYHQEKTLFAINRGFQCICIWGWDKAFSIVNSLRSKTHIAVSDCEIKEISESDANDFLIEHHVHGSAENQTVCLGLFYDGSLMQIMTFGKSQRKSDLDAECDWEIIRVCIDEKYAVADGAKWLWDYFNTKYHPKHTVAYCDISKFTGDIYYDIGMQLDSLTEPNKLWSKGIQMIPDDVLEQKGYAQLLDVENDDSISNEDYMLQNGWLPVYDCGYYRFII